MTAFTRTWDAAYEAIPEDDDDALEGAQRIRHIKEDLRERLEVDHSLDGDTHDGKHNKVTLRTVAAPTLDTGDMAVYAKTVSGKPELFVKDSDGNEIQITTTGSINAALPTGVVICTYLATAPTGWVIMNDGSIGDATSGATTRANADCEDLFKALWGSVSDTWAPVSSGRGASAQADWDAHKTIALPKVLGRALIAAGAGSGLTARTLGQALGNENLQSHTHGVTDSGHTHVQQLSLSNDAQSTMYRTGNAVADTIMQLTSGNRSTTPLSTASSGTGISIQNSGSGDSQNMQPSAAINVLIKL